MRSYPRFNFLSPEDLAMLTRVLDRTLAKDVDGETREAHAAAIVLLFQAGTTDEDALVEKLGGEIA